MLLEMEAYSLALTIAYASNLSVGGFFDAGRLALPSVTARVATVGVGADAGVVVVVSVGCSSACCCCEGIAVFVGTSVSASDTDEGVDIDGGAKGACESNEGASVVIGGCDCGGAGRGGGGGGMMVGPVTVVCFGGRGILTTQSNSERGSWSFEPALARGVTLAAVAVTGAGGPDDPVVDDESAGVVTALDRHLCLRRVSSSIEGCPVVVAVCMYRRGNR